MRSVGEREVEIRTRFPHLALLARLPWGPVLPRAALEAGLSPAPGTGPYRLESWEPGRGFVFVRNPHFEGPAPAFARAVHTVVPEDSRRVGLVERGEADAADHIPPEQVERSSCRRRSSGSIPLSGSRRRTRPAPAPCWPPRGARQ